MDDWGFEHLNRRLELRVELSVGPLFCIIDDRPVAGRGRPRRFVENFGGLLLKLVFADGSRHINSGTLMRWSSLGRVC
jgi:hypothetical protein